MESMIITDETTIITEEFNKMSLVEILESEFFELNNKKYHYQLSFEEIMKITNRKLIQYKDKYFMYYKDEISKLLFVTINGAMIGDSYNINKLYLELHNEYINFINKQNIDNIKNIDRDELIINNIFIPKYYEQLNIIKNKYTSKIIDLTNMKEKNNVKDNKKVIKKDDNNVKDNKKLIKKDDNNVKDNKKVIKNDNNNNVKEDKKIKKKSIPLTLKRLVWNKHIGEKIGKSLCLCCKLVEITQLSFSCGHIISEFNGGKITLDNLKPICVSCNSSMGTRNMNDFIKEFGL